MSVKRYFKREFQLSMFGLEEENAQQFYVSSFQKNRSVWPLLCIRLIVLLGCLGILLASMIMTVNALSLGIWFIFMTHWGIIFITITSALAFAVSVRVYVAGPIDATFGLPWYVKAYWVSYNFTIPIAFFITVFYWAFLTGMADDLVVNKTLDLFIHMINSVLMLVLLLSSSHPSRLLHFHHPLLAGITYLIFSIIYYYAGGLGVGGVIYIYPMLDWSQPALGTITAIGSAVMILLIHGLVVALAVARDVVTRNYRSTSRSMSISNDGFN